MPGRSRAEYTNEYEPGWFDRCQAESKHILEDIAASLEANTSDDLTRYTVAPGPAGLTRTAYYVGWEIVDALTRYGWTLAELSRVPEDRILGVVEEGIRLVQAE